ncbi:uncharacterized protein [Montipora foliosa]|uniref:uncharacterized protein n=1 Tax=Montipora foliosa TaxID=591990 RepID=UPI0035F21C8F
MDSESHLGIELQEDNKIPKKSCKFGKVVVGITGATALGNCSCQCTVCHASSEKRDKLLILQNRQKPLKGKDRRWWIWAVAMGEWKGYKDSIRRTHFPEMTCGSSAKVRAKTKFAGQQMSIKKT